MVYIIKKIAMLLILPALLYSASAYTAHAQLDGINDSISSVADGVNGIILILISGVFLFFVYNLIHWMLSGSPETKNKVVWSVIALFLVTSIWGITNFLGSVFNIDSSVASPQINTPTFGQ